MLEGGSAGEKHGINGLAKGEVDDWEHEHEVQDVADADGVVEGVAEGDAEVGVEVGKHIGIREVAEEEVAGQGCGAVDQHAEDGGDAADSGHLGRGAVVELQVDRGHVEVAHEGV